MNEEKLNSTAKGKYTFMGAIRRGNGKRLDVTDIGQNV